MSLYKAVIIDDERLAREEMKRALAHYPQFSVVGMASHVAEAITLIKSTEPDLLFLDIHMPEKSGFDLLEELTIVPDVVFTTAYNQYAVQAFEVDAIDYLVKPIREERFAKAIKKVEDTLAQKREPAEKLGMHQNIFIKDRDEYHFVPLANIRLIESVENYARIYFEGYQPMIKRSLNTLSEKLDDKFFFRANRGQLVNVQFIQKVEPYFNNKLLLTLQTGETLEVSSRQSVRFKQLNSL